MNSSFRRIIDELENPKPFPMTIRENVIIYGAGNTGKDLCRAFKQRGIKIRCFLDINAEIGSEWDQIPVLNPETDQIPFEERGRCSVIIAVFNRDTDILSIKAALTEYGYRNIYSFVEIYDDYSAELGERFWLTSRQYYRIYQDEIIKTISILKDDLSRQIYQSILHFRFTGDYTVLPEPDIKHQYMPLDLAIPLKPLRLLDCGAYTGEAISFFSEQTDVEAVIAFEPDPQNFAELEEHMRKSAIETVELWPCGVWDEIKQLKFQSSGNASSHFCETGNAMIQCVAIDRVIKGYKPTFIKMDIEGAESEAIMGARKTINDNLPTMAVCVYHRPDHIWSIPLLINDLFGIHYDIYLRSHGFNGFDLVMYALPKQIS